LPEASPADPSNLLAVIPILKAETSEILRSASLRENREIEDMCRQVVLIRSMLQESRVGDMPAIAEVVRRVHLQRLEDVGLDVSEDALKRATDTVGRMTPQERSRAAGYYFVRDHAALWLLSGRSYYLESDDDEAE